MGGAPTIEWIRPGVGYTSAAAASMRRLEAALGRPHDCNSSYRDYDKQLSMYIAWGLYAAGRGPYPGHSRAIHPDLSKHCQGMADDSDDWRTPGYIELAADHGWIRTAASDPTERHHFEYQWQRDKHRFEPSPAGGTAATTIRGDDEEMISKETQEWLTGYFARTFGYLQVPGQSYGFPEATLNDVRKFGGGLVARTDATNTTLAVMVEMLKSLDPSKSADLAAIEQKLRESEARSLEATKAAIADSSSSLRTELVSAISGIDGVDETAVTAAVDKALDRVFVRQVS